MVANYPKWLKKWIYVLLSLVLFSILSAGVFPGINLTGSLVVFALQNEKSDANSVPADTNSQQEKKPQRPLHKHSAFGEKVKQRLKMVRRQIQSRGVRDPNTLAAMRTVPRHSFVRPNERKLAYNDHPLPIGLGQTISQPYIVAFMTEALKLKPDSRVLEIGTGSGYQAAVCAEIAKEIYTIEIVVQRQL